MAAPLALSARTGAIEWSVKMGCLFAFSALAYDKGRIFAVNDLNRLFAFAAGTVPVLVRQAAWAALLIVTPYGLSTASFTLR